MSRAQDKGKLWGWSWLGLSYRIIEPYFILLMIPSFYPNSFLSTPALLYSSSYHHWNLQSRAQGFDSEQCKCAMTPVSSSIIRWLDLGVIHSIHELWFLVHALCCAWCCLLVLSLRLLWLSQKVLALWPWVEVQRLNIFVFKWHQQSESPISVREKDKRERLHTGQAELWPQHFPCRTPLRFFLISAASLANLHRLGSTSLETLCYYVQESTEKGRRK